MVDKPRTAKDHFLLGNLFLEQGIFAKAEEEYSAALKKGFREAKLYNNLGITQKSLEKKAEAEKSFLKAIKIDPKLHQAYNNLGNVLQSNNKTKEAVEAYKKAIAINPYFSNALNNLGTVWQNMGNLVEAIKYYKKALVLDPNYPDALNNLATAYQNQNKHVLAIKTYKKAIKVLPTFIEAHYNIASTYHDKDMPIEAIKYAERALKLYPEYQDALHLLLQQYKIICEWDKYSQEVSKLTTMTESAIRFKYRPGETPFFSITNFTDSVRNLEVAKLWGNYITSRLPNDKPTFSFKKEKNKKILKIGYLSSDFRNHVMGNHVIGFFKYHDKKRFKVYAYSYGQNDNSFNRKFIKKHADKFVDISKTNYIDAAKKINKDGIDILVDINGHTRSARLEIAALRPSPIQITYLGFPGTVGAEFFDYTIVDKHIVPKKNAGLYTECLIYFPQYQISSYSEVKGIKKSTRKGNKLPKGAIVFCSFNNAYKFDKDMFLTWLRILYKVPGSVLWLLEDNKEARQKLLDIAKKAGINQRRIIFAKRVEYKKHLGRIQLADIALDTFPYNGGATTSNALWSDVPVVSMYGKTYVSRMGKSLISEAGLPELVTENIKEYQKIAVDLAKNPKRLKEMQSKLASTIKRKKLFETSYFVKNMEKAYEKVWENWLKGNKEKRIIIS